MNRKIVSSRGYHRQFCPAKVAQEFAVLYPRGRVIVCGLSIFALSGFYGFLVYTYMDFRLAGSVLFLNFSGLTPGGKGIGSGGNCRQKVLMNLLCLNCGQEFTLEKVPEGRDGATVKCVHCGTDQPLFKRSPLPDGESGLLSVGPGTGNTVMPTGGDTNQSGTGQGTPTPAAGFRKPMSAMWAGSGEGSEPEGDPTVKMSPLDASSAATGQQAADDGSFVIGEGSSEFSVQVGAGPFVVTSPSMLVMEFPDFQVLDDWCRSIPKLDKYTIEDSTGDVSDLSDFVKKKRTGGRKPVLRGASVSSGVENNDTIQDVLTGGRISGSNSISPTHQFEFKISEEKDSRFDKKLLLWAVGAVVVLGTLAAALIFFYK